MTSIGLRISYCKNDELPPDETCMDDQELKDYLNGKRFMVYVAQNYFDNSDIDRPVKTYVKLAVSYVINLDNE